MQKKLNSIFLMIILIVFTSFTGCTQEKQNDTNSNPQLTNTDWDYFQFHYNSGKDLDGLFKEGFSILNKEIALVNPSNSSFLLEVNNSNKANLFQLKNVSKTIYENVTQYYQMLENYSVSSYFTEHKTEQKNLFTVYVYLANVFLNTYARINSTLNNSQGSIVYVDISDVMSDIFDIEASINSIMESQVNIVVSIPDEIWSQWDDKDWSFMR